MGISWRQLWPIQIVGPGPVSRVLRLSSGTAILGADEVVWPGRILATAADLHRGRWPVREGHREFGVRYSGADTGMSVIRLRYDPGGPALCGLLDTRSAEMAQRLVEAYLTGDIYELDFSIDCTTRVIEVEGRELRVIREVVGIGAIDFVTEGAAGGRFLGMLELESSRRRVMALLRWAEGRVVEIVQVKPAVRGPGIGRWRVIVLGSGARERIGDVEYVRSRSALLYPIRALERSIPLWKHVPVFGQLPTRYPERPGVQPLVREWIGELVNASWNAQARRVEADLLVVDSALAGRIASAQAQGRLASLGLAVDVAPVYGSVARGGYKTVERLDRIHSVDLTVNYTPGGRFLARAA